MMDDDHDIELTPRVRRSETSWNLLRHPYHGMALFFYVVWKLVRRLTFST